MSQVKVQHVRLEAGVLNLQHPLIGQSPPVNPPPVGYPHPHPPKG